MKTEVVFYELPDGREPAKDFLDSLDKKLKAKMFREIDLLMENGSDLRMPHSRSEGMVFLNLGRNRAAIFAG